MYRLFYYPESLRTVDSGVKLQLLSTCMLVQKVKMKQRERELQMLFLSSSLSLSTSEPLFPLTSRDIDVGGWDVLT